MAAFEQVLMSIRSIISKILNGVKQPRSQDTDQRAYKTMKVFKK